MTSQCGFGAEPAPHSRHTEEQRTSAHRGGTVRLWRWLSRVHQPRPEPQCTQHAEHQTMHVEQRQAVHEHVVGRPLPRVGQAIETGRDRTSRQHHTLGRARGAGCVHHQRRGGGVGFGRPLALRHRVITGKDFGQGVPRRVSDDRFGARVAQHVVPLGHPRVRRHRHDGHASHQRCHHGAHRVECGCRIDCHSRHSDQSGCQHFALGGQLRPRSLLIVHHYGIGAIAVRARERGQQVGHLRTCPIQRVAGAFDEHRERGVEPTNLASGEQIHHQPGEGGLRQ